MDAFLELRTRLAEIHDLTKVAAVLSWDQQTMMPELGGPARAEQLATLRGLAHERLRSPEIGRLLERLGPLEERSPHDSVEASLIRVTRRDHERARRVPSALRAEMARSSSLGSQAWADARARSDYAALVPYLERNVELRRRLIACFDGAEEPYDVLLEEYEPGMRTSEARAVLHRLKAGLLPLIAEEREHAEPPPSFLHGPFALERQRGFALHLVERMGFDPAAWRLDVTAHPFATSGSTGDIRLATRYDETRLDEGIFVTMHECGHGLYERGIGPDLERTPLCRPVSFSVHESQSRLWENIVGRGRPFWQHFYPALEATFPAELAGVGLDAFVSGINRVQPGPIRVGADEATYNLHIIMRFEFEQEIVAGSLALTDLPEAWGARMDEYLGVTVPDDAHGVLQDVHWASGSFGYFPTYALGNVMAVQLWSAAREALPDLDEQLAEGTLQPLRAWLGEHIHRHGRKLTPRETFERAAGGPLDPDAFVLYLREKLAETRAAAG